MHEVTVDLEDFLSKYPMELWPTQNGTLRPKMNIEPYPGKLNNNKKPFELSHPFSVNRCRGKSKFQMLKSRMICDGLYDCMDRTDESNCGSKKPSGNCPGADEDLFAWSVEDLRKLCYSEHECAGFDRVTFCGNTTFWRDINCGGER